MSGKITVASGEIALANGSTIAFAGAELSIENNVEPARRVFPPDADREVEFSFEVELDPRIAARAFGVDLHPMPKEWRERNR